MKTVTLRGGFFDGQPALVDDHPLAMHQRITWHTEANPPEGWNRMETMFNWHYAASAGWALVGVVGFRFVTNSKGETQTINGEYPDVSTPIETSLPSPRADQPRTTTDL